MNHQAATLSKCKMVIYSIMLNVPITLAVVKIIFSDGRSITQLDHNNHVQLIISFKINSKRYALCWLASVCNVSPPPLEQLCPDCK
jgi:hypothetical protein